MAIVIVERIFKRPRTIADIGPLSKSTEWCMRLHNVVALRHYLGTDGRRLICVFEAPDAEALRATIRSGGFGEPVHLWAATVHPAPGRSADDRIETGAGILTIVERSFAAPVVFDDVQALEDAGRHCFDLRNVSFLRSYFSTDHRRMLCLYTAPDAEAVREANQASRLPFDLAWPAEILVETPSPVTAAATHSG
jgi:hypothetical protein